MSALNYEQRVVNSASSKEPTEVIHFPPNDLEVVTVAREGVAADLGDFASARGYVVSCLRRYTRDWLVVRQNYDQYDGKTVLPKVVPPHIDVVDELAAAVDAKEPLAQALLAPIESECSAVRQRRCGDSHAHNRHRSGQQEERRTSRRHPARQRVCAL